MINIQTKEKKISRPQGLNTVNFLKDFGEKQFPRRISKFLEKVTIILIKNNSIYQFLLGGIDSFENQARFDMVTDMVFEIANAESVNLVDESPNENVDELSGEEFEDYYANVSAVVDDDSYFQLMIWNAWQLDKVNPRVAAR